MQKRWSVGALAIVGLVIAAPAARATILTFDVAGGVTNFQSVPADYGDNVAASPQAGHSYGVGAEGFTPDVVVDYGSPDELPALWTAGYGDLVNVFFNDQDSDTTMTVTFSAAAGFEVTLFDFDIASFSSGGQNLPGLAVRDAATDDVLFAQGATAVPGDTHAQVAPNATARRLRLVIDLTGLGMQSDNIGIDNLRFGQAPAAVDDVPAPAMIGLFGLALARLCLRRRSRVV